MNDQVESPLWLPDGEKIDTRILPGVEMAATAVRLGPFENGYEPYAALGRWVEANGYTIAGSAREEFLVLPTRTAAEAVVEIQLPIVPTESELPHLSDK